jgi:maleate isomerase
MATPYSEEIAKIEEEFFQVKGIQILNVNFLNEQPARMSYEKIYGMAKEIDQPESEAIFISCGGLQLIQIINKIENDMKKPVISTIQATIWNLLRLANINDKIEGYGQLFLR